MKTVHQLNDTLLQQDFVEGNDLTDALKTYQLMAKTYARIENAIAVLSDLKSNKSYIYHGKLADEMGLETVKLVDEIASIWEDDIFEKIHPDDLLSKHILELHFFQMLKNITATERPDYYTSYVVRMQNKDGQYVRILHRMFYVANFENGSVWLALCLYNRLSELSDYNPNGCIVNSLTGKIFIPEKQESRQILSDRELEILQLIRKGKISKEIALVLDISNHTVNRHRQNILEKLRVDNSFEACRIAERMQLL